MTRRPVANSLFKAVAMPTITALMLLSAIVGTVLHFSISASDDVAASRQERLIRLGVSQVVTTIAKDQEASTYWE